jgi:hypothetical protein
MQANYLIGLKGEHPVHSRALLLKVLFPTFVSEVHRAMKAIDYLHLHLLLLAADQVLTESV